MTYLDLSMCATATRIECDVSTSQRHVTQWTQDHLRTRRKYEVDPTSAEKIILTRRFTERLTEIPHASTAFHVSLYFTQNKISLLKMALKYLPFKILNNNSYVWIRLRHPYS